MSGRKPEVSASLTAQALSSFRFPAVEAEAMKAEHAEQVHARVISRVGR